MNGRESTRRWLASALETRRRKVGQGTAARRGISIRKMRGGVGEVRHRLRQRAELV